METNDCDDCISKNSCYGRGEKCNDYVKSDDENYEEDEDDECKRCNCTIITPYPLEPTEYCNLCAQALTVEFQEIISIISHNLKAGAVSVGWIERFIDKQMLIILKKDKNE